MKYIVLFLCAVSHILHCSSNSRNLDAFDAYDQSADSNKRESSNNPAVSKAKGFSGLYEPPKVGTEFYAGAWLAPKKRLLFSADNIAKITNLEGASFHLVLTAPVIHLSSTTNQFPQLEKASLQNELIYRMEKTVELLKVNNSATFSHRYRDKRILQQTVVVIPFSNSPASQTIRDPAMKLFTDKLRTLYLQATIWSVYRIFPNIVVTFGYKDQMEAIKALSLPIWKYVDLSEGLKSRYMLPRDSLMYTIRKLQLNTSSLSTLDEDRDWENINYVYYTEADHILHSRHLPNMYYALDRLDSRIALVPHRMQTIALPSTFAKIGMDSAWDSQADIWHPSKSEALRNVELVIEDVVIPQGSCCDDGRYMFGNCGNWWYNCKFYGLHNMTQWVRFGEDGFTLPFATEHQAKCRYSSKKSLCPMPSTCPRKTPRTEEEFCTEMPNVLHIPPK